MTNPRDIPDETKWRIATEFASRLPFRYEAAFRPLVGDRYDEIEQEIWMDLASTAVVIAGDLSLPLGSAEDIANTLQTVMVILFGPGFRNETIKVADNRSVILIKRCPFLERQTVSTGEQSPVFRRCMAFTLTAVPHLNRKFSARFVRTLCTGDRHCEIKIGNAEDLAVAALKKK